MRDHWFLKKRIVKLLALVIFIGCGAVSLKGETGIYATFSGAKLDASTANWTYGSTFGFYRDIHHIPGFDFGYDTRGTIVATDRYDKAYGGQWGPRMNMRLPIVHPYVEALGGAAHVRTGAGPYFRSNFYLSYALVGGAQVTLLPRLDWRVVDFTYGGYPGLYGHTNYKTIGTGLVVRLPY